MPKKPTKWGIKVRCLTDSVSRYVWTFEVNCRANKGVPGIKGSKKGEAMQGANVVHGLLVELENRGHIVIMDNFFFFGTLICGSFGEWYLCYRHG
jgi:hypothetical protein